MSGPCGKSDSDQRHRNPGQNLDQKNFVDLRPMLNEQGKQRPQKRPQSDNYGLCEGQSNSLDQEPKQSTCASPAGTEQDGNSKFGRSQAPTAEQRERPG